jgi:hypothetical protein
MRERLPFLNFQDLAAPPPNRVLYGPVAGMSSKTGDALISQGIDCAAKCRISGSCQGQVAKMVATGNGKFPPAPTSASKPHGSGFEGA